MHSQGSPLPMLFLYPWQPAIIGGPSIAGAYKPNPDRAEAPHPRPDGFRARRALSPLIQPRRSRTRRYVRDCSWPGPQSMDPNGRGSTRSRRTRSHPPSLLTPISRGRAGEGQHDCRCGRTDPACPARTVRHTRRSGANAPKHNQNKKTRRQPRSNESI